MGKASVGEAKSVMQNKKTKSKIKILAGWKAYPIRIRFRLSLIRYLIRRKKYPLFFLNPLKGGLIKTIWIQRKLKLKKIIRFKEHYYFSMIHPHWPSKPFDHMVANGGLNLSAVGTSSKKQIDLVILAITSKCNYHCRHCYEHWNLSETDIVPIERWKEVIKELQQIGVSIITLSGGEPMLRYEGLLDLLESSNKGLSEFHIHTAGDNVSFEKAFELKKAGLHAAGIGLDDVNPNRHDILRGVQGAYEQALCSIRFFQEANVFTYINMCLTKELVQSGDLARYYDLTKFLNVGAIRVMEPKPCGGYSDKNREDLFSEKDREEVIKLFEMSNSSKNYLEYPLMSYQDYLEAPARWGCMMIRRSHLYIDSKGNVTPCVFFPVSFGNIMKDSFNYIYKKMQMTIPVVSDRHCPAIHFSEKMNIFKNIHPPIPYERIEKEWNESFTYTNI